VEEIAEVTVTAEQNMLTVEGRKAEKERPPVLLPGNGAQKLSNRSDQSVKPDAFSNFTEEKNKTYQTIGW
jgi:hypothetical protein